VIAAGPLVSGLVGAGVGAAAGAATGGITASLIGAGIDEDTANYYTEGIRRGGTLVSVMADQQQVDQALRVMNQYNPIDVKKEGAKWRQSGWGGQDAQPASSQTSSTEQRQSTTPRDTSGNDQRLEVVQEELQVGKREVERGGVRVHTHVTETPVQEQVNLREEHVEVERRPVNRAATDADFGNDQATFEVTERAEEPVVSKQARVVEEVVVRKDVNERTETVEDSVRRKDVEVERTGTGTNDFATYDPQFQKHFQTTYANSGRSYSDYTPAYQYGYTLAADPRYRDYDWTRLESEARNNWETHNPNTWENVKDAVRYGWENVKASTR